MKAYWYRGNWNDRVGNVGDLLTPEIIEHLTSKSPVWSDEPGKLLAVGSIVECVKDNDTVWGSGLIKPMQLEKKHNVTVLAVRGKLTADAMRDAGYDVPDIYGDPAILMPDIYQPEWVKDCRVALVPHYVEIEAFRLAFPGKKIIPIISNVHHFIDQLLRCEKIITSSLHAYILARSYGVVAEYVQLTSKIIGGYYKYEDYLTGEGGKDKLLNAFQKHYRNIDTF